MFDSHMPRRSHTVPLSCHDHAVLKATSQDHGTVRHESGMGTAWYMCRPSRDGKLGTCPLSASSGYQAEFHEGYYQKQTSSSDISVYHADFHEGHGTVKKWQVSGMSCVN
jgi:hypothetical protein